MSRRRVPGWVMGLLVAGWVVQCWWPAGGGDEDKSWQAEGLARAVDVAMTLDRELGDGGAWVDFMIGSGDPEGTREWLEEELAEYGLAEETEMDDLVEALEGGHGGEDSLLASLVDEGRPPTAEEWRDLGDYYPDTPWYGVQAEAFRRISGGGAPDWVAEGLAWRESMERWMVWGTLAAALATLVFMLAGLAGPDEVWRSIRGVDPPPRRLALWPAGWVLLAFFASDLAANLALSEAYTMLGVLDDWPLWVDIGIDAGWRLGGVALLLVLMFPSARTAWRWFGMDRPTGWRATLGWLGLLLVLASIWYPPAGDWFPEATTVVFEEDGWLGLAYSVLSGVILAPLCEEIVYRGVLFAGLWRKLGAAWSAVLSSAVFAVVHHYGVAGTVGVFMLGVGCCLLYRRTGSLKGPILLHAIYNALITIGSWSAYNAPFSLGPP